MEMAPSMTEAWWLSGRARFTPPPARPALQQRLAVISFRPLIATPDEFRTLILHEHKRWGAIIREAGIKLD